MISVIIPTYCPQSYLWECLQSLSAQTLAADQFEVLIVLNGCNEPYYTQTQQFIAEHMSAMHVQLIQTDTAGVSNARNMGLDAAQGDYIAFIDDDDYVSATYLQEMQSLTTGDNIVICYPYAFNDGHPEQQLPYRITDAYDQCAGKSKISINSMARKFFSGPCMKLIPADYVKGKQFDVRFKVGEDSLFMFMISNKIKDIIFTSRNAIYYRRCRQGSAIFSTTTKQRIHNAVHLIIAYSQIYFAKAREYSFLFYLTRALGSLRSIIHI
jgi:glycosyltransferase involved in cell wall biosynthesis